jgi:hypothetical protein
MPARRVGKVVLKQKLRRFEAGCGLGPARLHAGQEEQSEQEKAPGAHG